MNVLERFIYHIKSNSHRYLSFFLLTIFSFAIFLFTFNQKINNYHLYNHYSNVSCNEIWFSENKNGHDCFVNLNKSVKLVKENKSINADILMQMENCEYGNNLFDINYELDDNQCIISSNIAQEYKLNIGDKIVDSKYNQMFEIVDYMTALNGIDKKYNHDGIVILSHSNKFSSIPNNSYIFFETNSYSQINVIDYIDIDEQRIMFKSKFILNISIYSLAYLIALLILEIFVFKTKENDYKLQCKDGIKKCKLLWGIFIDKLIIILLPTIICLLTKTNALPVYKKSFLAISLMMLSISFIYVFATTLFYLLRRDYYGKRK